MTPGDRQQAAGSEHTDRGNDSSTEGLPHLWMARRATVSRSLPRPPAARVPAARPRPGHWGEGGPRAADTWGPPASGSPRGTR